MSDSVIFTEQLSKTYGFLFTRKKKPSLKSLSISIPRGSVFGFLGPNGAGKTTTIRILMGLIRPTSGTAQVLGKPVWDVPVKKRIGFLPDTPAFNGMMTAAEFLNVCAKLYGLDRHERAERIREVLETVQMTAHAKEKIASFSRGMLQRIGVAQTLLNKPELLILDEPLLGLDPYGRQDFKDIILAQSKKGVTVFFSSHILSDVQDICDHAAILNKGNLLCCGSLRELLQAKGCTVRLRNADHLLTELMGDAKKIQKLEDGTRELVFPEKTPALAAKLAAMKEAEAEKIEIFEQNESLEDYFFRVIEKDNQNQDEKEQEK